MTSYAQCPDKRGPRLGLTSYARCYLYCLACAALMVSTAAVGCWALDLHALGWGRWVYALPFLTFLGACLCGWKAEALASPPCLTHYASDGCRVTVQGTIP